MKQVNNTSWIIPRISSSLFILPSLLIFSCTELGLKQSDDSSKPLNMSEAVEIQYQYTDTSPSFCSPNYRLFVKPHASILAHRAEVEGYIKLVSQTLSIEQEQFYEIINQLIDENFIALDAYHEDPPPQMSHPTDAKFTVLSRSSSKTVHVRAHEGEPLVSSNEKLYNLAKLTKDEGLLEEGYVFAQGNNYCEEVRKLDLD